MTNIQDTKAFQFLMNISKDLFIVKWSLSLYQQLKIFRNPKDIDIIIKSEHIDYFEFLSKKFNFEIDWPWEIDCWPYSGPDFIWNNFKFEDWSIIQIEINDNFKWEVIKSVMNLVSVNEVCKWKLKRLHDNNDFTYEWK